jgi:hypothetical protein
LTPCRPTGPRLHDRAHHRERRHSRTREDPDGRTASCAAGACGHPKGHAAGTGHAGQTGERPRNRTTVARLGPLALPRSVTDVAAARAGASRAAVSASPGQLIEHTSGPAQSNSSLPVERCPKLDTFHTGRRPNTRRLHKVMCLTPSAHIPGRPAPRYMRGTCCPPVSAASPAGPRRPRRQPRGWRNTGLGAVERKDHYFAVTGPNIS